MTGKRAVIFGASGGLGAALGARLADTGRYDRIYLGAPSLPQAKHSGAVPFRRNLVSEPFHRCSCDRFERNMVIGQYRGFHAGVPEVTKMLRGGGNGLLLTLRGKIARDLVRHIAQPFDIHRAYSAASTSAMRRLFSDQLA